MNNKRNRITISILLLTLITIFTGCDKTVEDQFTGLIHQGQGQLKKGDYQKAEETFSKAITLFPKKARGYLKRADVLIKQNLMEKANEDYEKVLELDPKNIDALTGKANILNQEDKIHRAIELYSKAINIRNARSRNIYYNRGVAKSKVHGGPKAGCHDFKIACRYEYEPACEAIEKRCGK